MSKSKIHKGKKYRIRKRMSQYNCHRGDHLPETSSDLWDRQTADGFAHAKQVDSDAFTSVINYDQTQFGGRISDILRYFRHEDFMTSYLRMQKQENKKIN